MAKKQTEKTVKWSYDERVSYPEFLKRIAPLVCDPVRNLAEMEGDMLLSDYRDLQTAFWKIKNALSEIEG